MIKVESNVVQVARQWRLMANDVQTKATVRALNETIEEGRTQMARAISKEYALGYSFVRSRLKVRKAYKFGSKFNYTAELSGTAKGRSLNMIHFAETGHILAPSLKEARARRKAGTLGRVFVKIKRTGGKKALGPTTFIANQGRTVFRRLGKERLPIEAVRTIGVPQMFNQKQINALVRNVMRQQFNKNYQQAATYYTSKGAR